MDRIIKKEIDGISNRLEITLEIIMEHFRETEDRMEEMADKIEELQNGIKTSSKK
jgi:uncharacterized membrane-anchored protein YhcB (DUF1043 family)